MPSVVVEQWIAGRTRSGSRGAGAERCTVREWTKPLRKAGRSQVDDSDGDVASSRRLSGRARWTDRRSGAGGSVEQVVRSVIESRFAGGDSGTGGLRQGARRFQQVGRAVTSADRKQSPKSRGVTRKESGGEPVRIRQVEGTSGDRFGVKSPFDNKQLARSCSVRDEVHQLPGGQAGARSRT